jgi:hypothetical protein
MPLLRIETPPISPYEAEPHQYAFPPISVATLENDPPVVLIQSQLGVAAPTTSEQANSSEVVSAIRKKMSVETIFIECLKQFGKFMGSIFGKATVTEMVLIQYHGVVIQ